MEASHALRGLRFELALLRNAVNDAFTDGTPTRHKVESANDHYELVRRYLADCAAEIDRQLGSQRRLAIGADASLAMQVLRRGEREAWPPVAGRLDAVCSELLEILAGEFHYHPNALQNVPPTKPPTAQYLGNGGVEVEGVPLTLDPAERDCVEALIELRTANLGSLIKRSGRDKAARILKRIITKHPALAAYIKLPGGRGRGGYSTTIEPVKNVAASGSI